MPLFVRPALTNLSEVSGTFAVLANPSELVVSLPMPCPLAVRHLESDEGTAARTSTAADEQTTISQPLNRDHYILVGEAQPLN